MVSPRGALDELMRVYRDQSRYLERADKYFRAEPSSVNIGSTIPPALARFRTAWPAVRVATNAFADRVKLEDVIWPDAQDVVEDFRTDLSSALNQAILESLATGTGYVRTVDLGGGKVTFQAVRGRDGAFLEDPDTGEVVAAMRIHRPPWYEQKGPIVNPQRVTVYTPGAWATFSIEPNVMRRLDPNDPWMEEDSGTAPNGGLLMIPLLNRSRAGEPYGRAEARDLYGLQDQGSRNLTGLAIAADALAVPQRALIAALPESISDLSTLETYMTSVLALSGDVKLDQWQAAQLQPFVEAAMLYGRKASEISGIPLSYWGISSEAQGASGDAIRENDARLEIRSREICNQFTKPLLAVLSVVAGFLGVSPGRQMAKWSDPSTPTPAAAADAALKLSQVGSINGQIVVDREMLWDILRVPPEDRERIKELENSQEFKNLLAQQAQVATPVPSATAQPPNSGAQ
jgi:hypothetical protein